MQSQWQGWRAGMRLAGARGGTQNGPAPSGWGRVGASSVPQRRRAPTSALRASMATNWSSEGMTSCWGVCGLEWGFQGLVGPPQAGMFHNL